MICLTGGEPLLHPDFTRIAAHIVSLGFPWGITTNGTLIDQKTAEKLRSLSLASVTISLDGGKETHEWLRQSPGCFERTLTAVAHLNDTGIPVQITSVIHRRNFHELDAMYDLMCRMKVASWRVINLEPIGRALQNQDCFRRSSSGDCSTLSGTSVMPPTRRWMCASAAPTTFPTNTSMR